MGFHSLLDALDHAACMHVPVHVTFLRAGASAEGSVVHGAHTANRTLCSRCRVHRSCVPFAFTVLTFHSAEMVPHIFTHSSTSFAETSHVWRGHIEQLLDFFRPLQSLIKIAANFRLHKPFTFRPLAHIRKNMKMMHLSKTIH